MFVVMGLYLSRGDHVSRAKRVSDETYNIRRRAKRAMQRAIKQGNTSLAQALQREIDKSYMDKGTKTYQEGIEQIKRNLRGLVGQEGAARANRKLQRSNVAFLSELRKAARGLPSAVTERVGFQAQLETNVFFAATRDMWEYVPGGNIKPLETVAGILGYDNLESAYRYIMGQQEEALMKIDVLSGAEPVDNIMQPTELSFEERYQYAMSYVNVLR